MGKAADQAVNSALADIRATKAQIEADIDAVRGAANDTIGTVMSLAAPGRRSDGAPSGAIPGGFDADKAAAAARQVAPKAAAAVGALGLTGMLAKRSKGKRARKKADARRRKEARIRAEELARAFGGSMPADAADAHLEAEQQAAEPEQPDKKSRKGTFALVLLAAAAAGAAAVYLSGRR